MASQAESNNLPKSSKRNEKDGEPKPKKTKTDSAPKAIKKKAEPEEIPICAIPSCKEVGLNFRDADKDGPEGYRCRFHGSQIMCTVENCTFLGTQYADVGGVRKFVCDMHAKPCGAEGCLRFGRKYMPEDMYGPAGYRCTHHNGSQECNISGCSEVGIYWCRAVDEIGGPGIRCVEHFSARQCAVKGCDRQSLNMINEADQYGGPGLRCQLHWKVCNVPSCGKPGKKEVAADKIGPAGLRCNNHGAMAMCSIPGCPTPARNLVPEADELGPAGYRCNLHGRQCNVTTCMRAGRRKMPEDEMGQAGWRCALHGAARACSVEACPRLAIFTKKLPDHLGPAGFRCPLHFKLCTVEGCTGNGRVNIKLADSLGSRGWRCHQHKNGAPLEAPVH